MKKLAKLLSVVLAALMVFSCIPTTMGAFALEPDAYAVANDMSDLNKLLAYELTLPGAGEKYGVAPTTTSFKVETWGGASHFWSTWSGVFADVDNAAMQNAKAVAFWVDFSQWTTANNCKWHLALGTVEDKTADVNADSNVNYLDYKAQFEASYQALDHGEETQVYLIADNGEVKAVNYAFDDAGVIHGVDFAGYKGWVVAPVYPDADLSDVNMLRISRNGYYETEEANGGIKMTFDDVCAVYDIESFITEKAAFADAGVVLNDASDINTISFREYQAMRELKIGNTIGGSIDGTYATASYYDIMSWNDWGCFVFDLTIPQGANVNAAEGIAVWVDFSNIVGNERWRLSELLDSEGNNLINLSQTNDKYILVGSDGNVQLYDVTEDGGNHGAVISGFKGWMIVPFETATDLSDVEQFAFHRNGNAGVADAANALKSFVIDNVTAVNDINAFVRAEANRFGGLNATVLNSFDTVANITSTYTATQAAVSGTLDGKGLSFSTTRNGSMTIPIPETNLADYEAIGFYVEKADDAYFTFTA
ncbi:MAG: hypothetical protein IJN65_00370, partial [Clostridia bacterium]|nr:hypothetical protein [Clostridia bacterium]